MGTNRSAATTSDTDTTSTDARALTAHSLSRTFRQRATNWLPIESLRAESTRTAAIESNRQLVTTQDPASPPPLHQTDETTSSRLIIADHPTSPIQVHDPETIIFCPTVSLDGQCDIMPSMRAPPRVSRRCRSPMTVVCSTTRRTQTSPAARLKGATALRDATARAQRRRQHCKHKRRNVAHT